MRVLLIHNFYISSSPSGEDVVFRNELNLLKKNKVNIISYTKHNDEILNYGVLKKCNLVLKNIWSWETYKELKKLIRKKKPDICHFHNIFYLISPSAYFACKDSGVPVVQTLHNFRMFCANGLLMREGKICETCFGRLPFGSIAHSCYKDSRIFSLSVALMEGLHRLLGTWNDKIDAYIALTEFGKKKFVECRLDEKKIFVKPNFLANPPEPFFDHDNYVVFVGRLAPEKGLFILIDALKKVHLKKNKNFVLKVIGNGPLRKQLEDKVVTEKLKNIKFVGRKNFKECMKLMQGAKFMIMPSIWYETFGLTGIEAFACGKPVIASRLGAMAELIKDGKTGLLFEPGNPDDLAAKIQWMLEHEDACVEMGKNSRKEFEEKYTAEKNFEILLNIYQSVLKNRSRILL